MSKPVKLKAGREFTFRSGARGGRSKYDWDAWFTGELLLLEQSAGDKAEDGSIALVTHKRDYDGSTNAMVPKLKIAGRRRYKVIQVSRVDVDGNPLKDSLIIRSRDMTDDERMGEDLLRAEEKAALKAKRAAGNGQDDPSAD